MPLATLYQSSNGHIKVTVRLLVEIGVELGARLTERKAIDATETNSAPSSSNRDLTT